MIINPILVTTGSVQGARGDGEREIGTHDDLRWSAQILSNAIPTPSLTQRVRKQSITIEGATRNSWYRHTRMWHVIAIGPPCEVVGVELLYDVTSFGDEIG